MGEYGATCFHTLSDQPRDLSKPEWDAIRFGQVCTAAENFANWRIAIEQLCNDTKICTYEVLRAVDDLARKVQEQHQLIMSLR